jgi:hypothetical protein
VTAAEVLREAAYKIDTLANRDITAAIRAAAPTAALYSEAVRLFRAHIKGERPRPWKQRHNTTATAAALRDAARGAP